MELVIIEKSTKKRVKLFSNQAEKVLDSVTTKYNSEEEFLESLGLDSKNFSVVKTNFQGKEPIDFEFLPRYYEGFFNLINDDEEREDFVEQMVNSNLEDLETINIHVCSELMTRSKYHKHPYLSRVKEPIKDVFSDLDGLKEQRQRNKREDDPVLNNWKSNFKKSLNNYLYDDGKPVYTNFLGFYRFLCDNNKYERDYREEDPFIKEELSSVFRSSLSNYIENGVVEHVPRNPLLKVDTLKDRLEELKIKKYDDQPLYSAITETYYSDIDDFEKDLDILMDEQGLDDEEKITARDEMRKSFEKKNKLL